MDTLFLSFLSRRPCSVLRKWYLTTNKGEGGIIRRGVRSPPYLLFLPSAVRILLYGHRVMMSHARVFNEHLRYACRCLAVSWRDVRLLHDWMG